MIRDDIKAAQVAAMKACTYCGVHVPVGQGVSADGKFYCGEEHRRAAQQS